MKRLVDWIINLITEKPLLAAPAVSCSCSILRSQIYKRQQYYRERIDMYVVDKQIYSRQPIVKWNDNNDDDMSERFQKYFNYRILELEEKYNILNELNELHYLHNCN